MHRILVASSSALVIALAMASPTQAQDYGEEEGAYGAEEEGAYGGGGDFEAGGDFEGGGDVQGGGDFEGGGDFAEPGAEMDVEGTGLPLPYAQRPLTLTEGTIRGDAAFRIARIQFTFTDPVTGGMTTASDTQAVLALGGAYGIMDDLEVGAEIIPLQLAPDADYLDPSVYGIFRFLSGGVDIGAGLAMSFPVQGDFVLTPSLPVLAHLGDSMRLDTGVALPIQFADPDTIVSLSIPLRFSFNATPNVFFGGSTGFNLPDFDSDLASLPLGFHGGYTLESGVGGPMADFLVEFAFPHFLLPGSEGDVVFTNLWTLTFGANIYIDT